MQFRVKTYLITALLTVYLSACAGTGGLLDTEKFDKIDGKKNLSRNDYKNIIKPNQSEELKEGVEIKAESKAPPIPEVAPLLAAPRPPKIGQSRLVSLAVTDDVPLKDVLIELARLADVDVEIDAGIKGGIAFRAKDRPFNEVIERIAGLAGLRYNMKNGVLRIERDLPYIQNYNLDFLNIVRSSDSSTSISTDVLSLSGSAAGGEGGGSGLTTGSSSSISAKGEDDFWEALKNGVSQILAYEPTSKLSEEQAEEGDPAADAAKAGGAAAAATGDDKGKMVINRRAGVLSVSATSKQHELIRAYLEKLEQTASAQVLIEAKIVEVSLDDEFSSGIDWSMAKGNTNISVAQAVQNTSSNLTTLALGDGNLGVDLNAAIKLTENFGTTRTLSSPRLHAINNQQAVLTFAENKIFFEVTVEQEDDQIVDGVLIAGKTTVESKRRSVPIGIILNIMPSINLRNNEVTLSVRPTLSRQVDTVTDPGSALVNQIMLEKNPNAETFENKVPIVEVRELDSILKIKSGQVMVIGGLMEETANNTEKGVPGAQRIPWFGNLFKSVENVDKIKELIIFIRATIVTPNGNYHATDRKIYEKFTDDARPIAF